MKFDGDASGSNGRDDGNRRSGGQRGAEPRGRDNGKNAPPLMATATLSSFTNSSRMPSFFRRTAM